MSEELSLKQIQMEWHGTLVSYLIGFSASLLLTITAFALVFMHLLSGTPLLFAILILAIVQATVQVIFFLHVGQEAKPRWESIVFYFMVLVLVIIAAGSLWIMYDLNDRTMANMTKEMDHD